MKEEEGIEGCKQDTKDIILAVFHSKLVLIKCISLLLSFPTVDFVVNKHCSKHWRENIKYDQQYDRHTSLYTRGYGRICSLTHHNPYSPFMPGHADHSSQVPYVAVPRDEEFLPMVSEKCLSDLAPKNLCSSVLFPLPLAGSA